MKKSINYIILYFLIILAGVNVWQYLISTNKKTDIPKHTVIQNIIKDPIVQPNTNNLNTNPQLPNINPSASMDNSQPINTKQSPPTPKSQTTTKNPSIVTAPVPIVLEQQTKNLPNPEKITLKITNQKTEVFNLEIKSSSTVFEILKQARENQLLSFDSNSYSYGELITEINGIKNSQNTYWFLYLNSKRTPYGASQQKVQNNDTIEWKYEN